jgi:Mg2+ and Co2+ transporter CorA
MYSQLQGQVSSMEEAIKDKEGTIETLERQLVQAGIKMKVGDAANEVRKDVLETEAQQKLLRGMLKAEFDRVKKDMKDMVKSQPTEEAEEVETE